MTWQIQMGKRLLKSVLPFQDDIRLLKRRLAPYSDTQDNGAMALRVGLYQIRLLRVAGANLQGNVMELGTGWLPILALLFHLAGSRHLVLTDIRRLMDERTILRARTLVAGHLPLIAQELRHRGEQAAGTPRCAFVLQLPRPMGRIAAARPLTRHYRIADRPRAYPPRCAGGLHAAVPKDTAPRRHDVPQCGQQRSLAAPGQEHQPA